MGPCFRREDVERAHDGLDAAIASQRVGAKRRPMTGSAKQSSFRETQRRKKAGLLRRKTLLPLPLAGEGRGGGARPKRCRCCCPHPPRSCERVGLPRKRER